MQRSWVAVTALVAACGLPDTDYFGNVPDPDPTHMTYCNSAEPEFLDPALVTSTTGLKISYAMFTGLTDHDLQGFPEPGIAERWDVGPRLQTFTFHLRKDAVWSPSADGEFAGRPITSEDFKYSLIRVLNPYTLSANAETLWLLENGALYYFNRARRVLRNSPPFAAGDVVQIVGVDDEVEEQPGDLSIPDTNTRRSATPLALRDYGEREADAYQTVPAGKDVVIIELAGDGDRWAYIFWAQGNGGDGIYGWVPTSELTIEPYGDTVYAIRSIDDPNNYERTGTALGRDLLMLPELVGIETPDPYTLVLKTDNPIPYLIAISPQGAFRPTPRERVSRRPKRWILPEHISTSSAFHMVEWKKRDKLELVKSPTYFDRDTVKLERITVFNIDDEGATANLYFQGSCDATTANNVPSSYYPALRGDARGGRAYKDYHTAPYLGLYLYLIQTEKLNNVHLRRALNYAVDRSAFPKILRGGETPSAQLTPGTPADRLSDAELALCGIAKDHPGLVMLMADNLCYVPPPGLDFNVDKAREELAIAKQEMGAEFPKRLSVKYNTGKEGHKFVAEYLQSIWQQNLGIEVQLASQEWKTFLKDTRDGDFQVARMGWIGNFSDMEAEFMPSFKCGVPDNRTQWCNKQFMALYARMEATMDRKQRLAILYEMEELLMREAPIIPLYVYTQHQLQRPYMRDLAINVSGQQPWRKAWIDPNWRQAENP